MTSATGLTILTVDDNPATLYSTSRVLKSAGFDVLQAASGTEALDRALLAPDLIVLDVDLPDMSGFEVCRRLREIAVTVRTPVIYLSASFVSDYSKVQGLEAGADGYLTHPVEPPVLIATVSAFLRARQAEVALRQSEAKFRTMFDQSLHGICLLDPDLMLLEANPALCNILQRSHEELVGTNLMIHLGGESDHALREFHRQLGASNSFKGILPLRQGNGDTVMVDFAVGLYSQPGISLATVIDATERLAIEQEREQLLASERAARQASENANRLKDEFLATLSHELRTPLSAIVGWAQLLKFGKCTPKDIAECAEIIERNAKIQTQLIADLLDVSRITSGKLRLDLQVFNPAELVAGALDSVTAAAGAKGVHLIRMLHSQVGPIQADPGRLHQIVWNLVNNAVKFTPSGGTVEVYLRENQGNVEIIVHDNGQGIDAAFLPHIFERFRQEDASTRRGHGGLGLGLAIVKQLVEMQGGTVRGESPGEGLGATFTVKFPMATPAIPSVAVEPADLSSEFDVAGHPAQLADLTGVKILVVDDDEDTRQMMNRVLAECGAETVSVATVAHALEKAELFQPEVLVSDIGMPGQDGYDLIRKLRHRGFTPALLPAIALTAFARLEDRERSFSAGYQLHLHKPIMPSQLTSAVFKLVQQKQR